MSIVKVAKNIINHSLRLESGSKLVMESFDIKSNELGKAISNYCQERGINIQFLNRNIH